MAGDVIRRLVARIHGAARHWSLRLLAWQLITCQKPVWDTLEEDLTVANVFCCSESISAGMESLQTTCSILRLRQAWNKVWQFNLVRDDGVQGEGDRCASSTVEAEVSEDHISGGRF